ESGHRRAHIGNDSAAGERTAVDNLGRPSAGSPPPGVEFSQNRSSCDGHHSGSRRVSLISQTRSTGWACPANRGRRRCRPYPRIRCSKESPSLAWPLPLSWRCKCTCGRPRPAAGRVCRRRACRPSSSTCIPATTPKICQSTQSKIRSEPYSKIRSRSLHQPTAPPMRRPLRIAQGAAGECTVDERRCLIFRQAGAAASFGNWGLGERRIDLACEFRRPRGLHAAFKLSPAPMHPSLKIVIVDENPIRAAILEDGLREAGHVHVVRLGETSHLLARIYALDPDVILIDLENPRRDVLEQMFQVSRAVKRPIAMFVDQSDKASIEAAVEAGVSAYIVGGLDKERIKTILDLCISRFNSFARLRDELERARTALEERKVIDRAKGILMTAKNLTEEAAYALLRKTAMNESKKIAEVAQSVVTAAELLK